MPRLRKLVNFISLNGFSLYSSYITLLHNLYFPILSQYHLRPFLILRAGLPPEGRTRKIRQQQMATQCPHPFAFLPQPPSGKRACMPGGGTPFPVAGRAQGSDLSILTKANAWFRDLGWGSPSRGFLLRLLRHVWVYLRDSVYKKPPLVSQSFLCFIRA